MKSYVRFIVLIAAIIVSLFAITVSAATIDELVANYNISLCLECHADVAENLLMSNHVYSIINPRVILAIKNETKASKPAREAVKGCLSCHAPITDNASDDLLDKIATLIVIADNKHTGLKESAIKELSKLSINCLVCHMMKGMPVDKIKPKVIYGPGWDEHEHSHKDEYGFDTLKSDYFMSSEFCLSCHSGPLPSHKNYKTHYTDTKKTCHQCHMNNHKFSIALPLGAQNH
jgi:hypothetical protein